MLKRLVNYINGSRQELKKVVWPTKKEVTQHTIMVIVISIGVSVFLGAADYIFNIILENII